MYSLLHSSIIHTPGDCQREEGEAHNLLQSDLCKCYQSVVVDVKSRSTGKSLDQAITQDTFKQCNLFLNELFMKISCCVFMLHLLLPKKK